MLSHLGLWMGIELIRIGRRGNRETWSYEWWVMREDVYDIYKRSEMK